MKVEAFEVIGLFGKENRINLKFNSDINIITGRNGTGKTSVLKLLWYILSGNILLALKEINFKRARLSTSEYECIIQKISSNTCRVEWKDSSGQYLFEDQEDDDGDIFRCAEDSANQKLRKTGSSVFLPTFRRIEGGFTINDRQNPFSRDKSDIEESLISLSRKLTNENHVFVASLSTVDIVNLLIRQHSDLSEQYNDLQQNTSDEIIRKIRQFEIAEDSNSVGEANRVLKEIRSQIQGMENSRDTIMKPLETVKSLVMKLFRHSGIKLGRNLSFGDAASAINSDALSAGEKQMLSFIAYNAFYDNSIIIIDEPELSLHVDWQRQLFPTLLGQQASNQFIFATHSPFIYGKYPDKELLLDEDRGDGEIL